MYRLCVPICLYRVNYHYRRRVRRSMEAVRGEMIRSVDLRWPWDDSIWYDIRPMRVVCVLFPAFIPSVVTVRRQLERVLDEAFTRCPQQLSDLQQLTAVRKR